MDDTTFQRLSALSVNVIVEQFLDQVTDKASTRAHYRGDIDAYMRWYESHGSGLHPLAVGTSELNNYIRHAATNDDWAPRTKSRRYGTRRPVPLRRAS